jgi:hypothetical protein
MGAIRMVLHVVWSYASHGSANLLLLLESADEHPRKTAQLTARAS